MPPAKASDMLASILASAADRLAVLNATDTHERLQTVLVLVQQVCFGMLLSMHSLGTSQRFMECYLPDACMIAFVSWKETVLASTGPGSHLHDLHRMMLQSSDVFALQPSGSACNHNPDCKTPVPMDTFGRSRSASI